MCRPAVALPEHRVELDELVEHVSAGYADHPRLDAVLRGMRSTTVRTRWFSRPFAELARPGPRPADHHADACALAVRAARAALAEAGLDAADVDGLITSNTTGFQVPGVDVHLIGELGLRPTVRRVPVTQLGCAGGVYGLVRAAERPAETTLVVTVELLSWYYRPGQTTMPGMILKALLGDAAGAVVVRGDDAGTGLVLGRGWECVLPETAHHARAWLSEDGPMFESDRRLLETPRTIAAELAAWFGGPPRFFIAHPGGPRIMAGMAEGLGLGPDLLHDCRESLSRIGNVGGTSVFDVAARAFRSPPPAGARGILFGLGPGLTAVACEATWQVAGHATNGEEDARPGTRPDPVGLQRAGR